MRRAVQIQLDPKLKSKLQTITRSPRSSVRLVERCQIVLLASEGLENREIAERFDISRQKAGHLQTPEGLADPQDAPGKASSSHTLEPHLHG